MKKRGLCSLFSFGMFLRERRRMGGGRDIKKVGEFYNNNTTTTRTIKANIDNNVQASSEIRVTSCFAPATFWGESGKRERERERVERENTKNRRERERELRRGLCVFTKPSLFLLHHSKSDSASSFFVL